ncbi:MAG: hypothetical protein GC156_06130 [Actinomycetales bacterium]|nr:hypothetical protein [Actinomycetales bacterium]
MILAEPPSWTGAAHARNLSSAALRLGYSLGVHGAHHVGSIGPLVMVCRGGEGLLAGSILQATVTRPVHVVANEAMGATLGEGVMQKAGMIPVHPPFAIDAQRQAMAAVLDDRAVAVTGSGFPVGYLLAATGAPVMAVTMIGAVGRVPTDPPRPRSRIEVYYAEPVRLAVADDPLRPATRAAVEEQVRQIVADHAEESLRRSGRRGLEG